MERRSGRNGRDWLEESRKRKKRTRSAETRRKRESERRKGRLLRSEGTAIADDGSLLPPVRRVAPLGREEEDGGLGGCAGKEGAKWSVAATAALPMAGGEVAEGGGRFRWLPLASC